MSSRSHLVRMALTSVAAATLIIGTAAAGDAQSLPLDQESSISGVPVACTGIGEDERDDPRWSAYNAKIEVARADGTYLGSETVTVTGANGGPAVTVECAGPWVLMKLPDGGYKVTADLGDASKTVTTHIGGTHTTEVVLSFNGGAAPSKVKTQD